MINNVTKHIIQRFGIEKFIETGVFMGDTMMIVQDWFCELFGDEFNTGPWNKGTKGKYRMYEIESNQNYFDQYIKPRWQNQINVECIVSDSVEWLKKSISNGELHDKCFFYLDAHSHNSPNPEPLAAEITEIRKLKTPIISADDWHVPGKNYDIYNLGQIRHLINDRTDAVYYSDKHNFHGKYSIFIFFDRQSSEIDSIIKDLPLIKEKL